MKARKRSTSSEVETPLEAFTAALIEQGVTYPDIEKALLEKGVSQSEAEALVLNAVNRYSQHQANPNPRERRAITRGAAVFNMLTGAAATLLPVGASMMYIAQTRGSIDAIVGVYGAVIVFGLSRFIKGLWQWFERE